MYEKQNFYSGQKLKASQLDAIEEGIRAAERSSCNLELGTGIRSVQQLCREDKVSMKDGETVLCFLFEGHTDSPYNGTRVQFGAVGDYSISLGGRSAALGKCSIALNNQTIAVEENSCALGYSTTALGACAIAGGTGTLAIGEAAVSLGMSTVAEAIYSLATGARTRAKGDVSSSFGVDTVAEAYASSVFGQWTIAREVNQTVVGQFNDPNKLNEHFHSVFQVGVGSSEETRMNGISISEGGEIAIRWNNAYYSLQGLFNILNNMLNMAGGVEGEDFFGEAKIK